MELNHHPEYYQYHNQADTVRSFKCSFCKRGFPNAQALGGHMNIHRKDRAKLRQLSSQDNDDDQEIHETHGEHNNNRIRRSKRTHGKEHCQLKQQQLPLSTEATQWAGCSVRPDFDEDLYPGLDLELRLGPEPDHHRMAACLDTRNFF